MQSLGKGFDLTSDFRLRFTKGGSGRLVVVDEENKRDILIPPAVTFKDVSQDIRVDKGDRIRFQSDVLQFNQVVFSLPTSFCSNLILLFTFKLCNCIHNSLVRTVLGSGFPLIGIGWS